MGCVSLPASCNFQCLQAMLSLPCGRVAPFSILPSSASPGSLCSVCVLFLPHKDSTVETEDNCLTLFKIPPSTSCHSFGDRKLKMWI